MMAVPAQTSEAEAWESVLRKTKVALETNADPNLWAFQVSSTLNSSAISLPSAQLAHRLVSLFFWDNHSATAWKLLHAAMSLNMLPPSLLVALLSSTVVPSRQRYPIAYRLYLELLKEFGNMIEPELRSPDYKMIMKSIDEVLQLSQLYSQKVWEPGVVLVEFIFSIVWQLLEASLDDEGLLDHTIENKPRWLSRSHDMDIDGPNSFSEKKSEHVEGLQKINTAIAVEIIAEFLQHKMTSRILSLVHWNMSSHWGSFIHQMQLLVSSSSVFKNLKDITAKTLLLLTQNIHEPFSHAFKTKSKMETNLVIPSGSQMSFAGQSYGDSWSSLWLPIDLIMEDALQGGQVAAFSAIEIITGLVKTLHAVNGNVWHNTFLGLWVAALRLVQGERDSKHSPIPRLDTSMCMLLSITTLLVANIIEEEEGQLIEETEHSPTNQGKDKQALTKCHEELITSLQLLGAYESLLTPPEHVLVEANQAAAKAIMFLSGNPVGSGYFESMSMHDTPLKCSGNLRHLIVEACIAKNLLDTSAYSWPGYVNACSNQIPCSISNHVSGWSSLMEGLQLIPALVNVLVETPASSLAEIEKIYEIALNGSDEEKISAATILCGASLLRGWNIQEHAVIFITKLLSPLVPPNHSEAESHLTSQAPVINVLLVEISSIEYVHIFSLHGAVCLVFNPCSLTDV